MTNQEAPKRSFFLLLFGLVFTLAGGFFLFFVVREFVATADTYRWDKVPAKIVSIDIEYPQKTPRGNVTGVFELVATYQYSYAGVEYSGTRFRRQPYRNDTYEKLADRQRDTIRNEWDSAFVNPADPTQAILECDSLWFGLLMLFPLPFILIGTACMAGGLGWFPSFDPPKRRFKSAQRGGTSGLAVSLTGAALLCVGFVLLYFLTILPWRQSQAAGVWKEVPCEVIWSRVRVHEDDDGATYSPDIFYAYQYEGETFRSNRYSFSVGSSSGRSSKQRIVKKYPAGKQATCYVDPATPWHAVINPNKSIGFLWILGAIFSAIGALTLRSGLGMIWKGP